MGNANSGRRPSEIPTIKWKISIPESLAAEVEILLYDPLTGQPAYGGRAQLLEDLLRGWVAKERNRGLTQAEKPAILGAD